MRTLKIIFTFFVLTFFVSNLIEAANQKYKYDQKATVSGKLVVTNFYGPPGYGEDPENDSVEKQCILYLDGPIDVVATNPKEEIDITEKNVKKITLVPSKGMNCNIINKKRIRATGTFFHASTGHHHTDILMDVDSFSIIKKKK
uniref:DUF4431 domain-containing protein n=1 Tax=candidate division CPR3 bacterium TaxID=2268181 RepID=A0A7C4M0N2_UNCC3